MTTTFPRSTTHRSASKRRGVLGRRLIPYLFLAPFFALFAMFLLAPLFYALKLSLYRIKLIGGEQFVGWENYWRAVTDEKLWSGLGNLVFFGVVQVPIMLGLALTFAIVLDRGRVPNKSIFRIGFFLPYAVPSVVAAILWGYLYGPVFGPFSQVAHMLGLPTPNFLAPNMVPFSIANIVTWEFVGYNMVIFYSALKAISGDLNEAARSDGATPWQFARTIQIPLLWPTVLLTLLFSINGTFQLFNEPYLMRALASNTITSSYTPNLYAYALATAGQQSGYAAAVSFVLGCVIAAVSVLFMWVLKRRSAKGGAL